MHIASVLRNQLTTILFHDEPGCISTITESIHSVNIEGKRILIICDSITRAVAGNLICEYLSEAHQNPEIMELDQSFGNPIPADYSIVKVLVSRLGEEFFPVAVGAGTINDLVKRASFEVGTQYLCVPTAPSIDGYCSSGAALVKNGLKSTLECPPPVAIVADPEILKTAPAAMIASGYGDLYAKLAAGMDWILADRLNVEKIDPQAWNLVQNELPNWLKNPKEIFNAESETFANLFRGLTYSGFAMQLYHDSRPASGAEHIISHIWEMEHLSKDGIPVSHGFKVALGTVITTSLMEKLFEQDPQSFDVEHIVASRSRWEDRVMQIRKYFPNEPLQSSIIKICQAKWPEDIQLTLRLERFRSHLPEFSKYFSEQLQSSNNVKNQLSQARCPVSLNDLGIDNKRLYPTLIKAQMIRQRYTILDVLYETGLFDQCIESLSV